MDREEAISIIDALYPTDSGYHSTDETGKRLLAQAKAEIGGATLTWRNEPTRVLVRYAELCQAEEEKHAREFLRKNT